MTTEVQSEPLVAIPGGFYRDSDHTYWNESRVVRPSVTQILAWSGWMDYDFVRQEILDRKSDIGRAGHFAAHIMARGDELDWDTVHDAVVPYVLGVEAFFSKEKFVVDVVNGVPQTEICGVHKTRGLEYGYTFDLRGKMDGFPCIIDLKFTYGVEASWEYQLAGYELTQPRPEGSPTYGQMVVRFKPDGTYKLHAFKNPRAQDCFLWCLATSYEKMRHGLTWERKENANGR